MTSTKSSVKEKRLFGRRKGKPLKGARAAAFDSLLPKLSIPEQHLTRDGKLSLNTLFEQSFPSYSLEIGFGNGEHLNGLLERHAETGFIGVEPYMNGMATFLRDIKDTQHTQTRVLMDDAMLLAESLEDECLDKIYVLNPDPWHKTRHHKRRIIQHKNLDHFARILKPGGMLISSTDVPYLAEWITTQTVSHSGFEWTANSAQDWKTKPEWWGEHRYAIKGAKGASEMHYLIFQKKS